MKELSSFILIYAQNIKANSNYIMNFSSEPATGSVFKPAPDSIRKQRAFLCARKLIRK
jgi:hypothetical protein